MLTPEFYVGIDVASETLAIALTRGPRQPVGDPFTVANDPDGFAALAATLAEHGATPGSTLVCLEATGVYGEALCYWLHERGYRLAVRIPPRCRGRRQGQTRDAPRVRQDRRARRGPDRGLCLALPRRAPPWTPAEAVVEQVRTLLTMREQLTRERNGKQNARRMLTRKVVQTPLANRIADDAVAYLKDRIAEIDAEVRRLVSSHPAIGPAVALVMSVPGVGLLLASHLCVATGGFSRPLRPKQASAWLGICPLEHESGASVRRRPRSRGYGPSAIRKLLYLASIRLVSIEGSPHRAYFLRKKAEGKSGRLVLNNVGNKLLRVAAVLRDGRPYEANHESVRPAI